MYVQYNAYMSGLRQVTCIVCERQLHLYGHVARLLAEDPAHRILSCLDPRGCSMSRGRPHASWLRQVESYLDIRSSASPRPPCDGTHSASVWPSPRQTPGPPCPYPSDRTSAGATTKPVDAPSAWFNPSAWTSPSDLDRKEPDEWDPPQGVAPHAHRGVVGTPELCR